MSTDLLYNQLAHCRETLVEGAEKQLRIQSLLDRCWDTLDRMPDDPLKARLLALCYAETMDDSLADEARTIIDAWNARSLTEEQLRVIDEAEELLALKYEWTWG